MSAAKDVDAYIAAAPPEVRPILRRLRAAVRTAAPQAVESLSYGMPFYSFRGESGFKARLCYFGTAKKEIVFYTRPLFLEEHLDESGPYMTSKSALHFRLDRPIPVQLVRRVVRDATRKHAAEKADPD